MNCDICSRDHSASQPFFCTVCARGTIYISRLELARTLLEKEQLGTQVEAIVKPDSQESPKHKASMNLPIPSLARAWSATSRQSYMVQSEARTKLIGVEINKLHGDIDQARLDIVARRAAIAEQKANLDSIRAGLLGRRRLSAEKMTETTGKGLRTFDNLHKKTSETRAFLCQEAAVLLRFKQKKRKKDGAVKDHYYISGLPVVDIRDISGLRCAELTASLSSIAHLLYLVSFYLSVRLPAEVITPHRDYPLPTIYTPANSYLNKTPHFPGTTPVHSGTGTPTTSKHSDSKPFSRPRPLFIIGDEEDDKVIQVAKKDPASFAFFVEGLSLLAWDIAWLCRSQGFIAGTDSWEDICNIGRNLWQLLLSPAQPSALMRVLSSRDVQDRQRTGKEITAPANPKQKDVFKLGKYSHSSAHSFLGAPAAQDLFRSWKLAKHTMVVDPLKKALWAEMNNAEWELLQEQEWDDGGEQFDEAVFIKTRIMDGHEFDDARSIMTARPGQVQPRDGASDAGDSARAKGTSGWTKVKSRDK